MTRGLKHGDRNGNAEGLGTAEVGLREPVPCIFILFPCGFFGLFNVIMSSVHCGRLLFRGTWLPRAFSLLAAENGWILCF